MSTDESDSNHSCTSVHSDGGDLPSFPTFSSPTKTTEQPGPSVSSPGGITATLSAASLATCTPEKKIPQPISLDHFSPYQSHIDRKALEHSRKLARKAKELGKRVKVKTERNEKVCLCLYINESNRLTYMVAG